MRLSATLFRLYEPVFSESGDTIYMMDQIGDNNDDRNWLDEIALKEAIIGLDDREKNILKLRFFRGKTQVEVAQEIGISQAQVSRLEKGALGKIKRRYNFAITYFCLTYTVYCGILTANIQLRIIVEI